MDKKTTLETKKKQLLHEIQYYESQIAEARRSCSVNTKSDEGSDSDSDTPMTFDTGPSSLQLKRQQEELHNCLNATQELCDINIIESEVNLLVEPPQFTNEPPVTEPGTWREVTAECTVDRLVPFVISFYVHQPERRFAPTSFRGLRVQPIKSKHEVELSKSVLPDLARPSDAVEVIRSYAAASRSRRDTLAQLHAKFGADIVMDAKPEGGFLIGCANLLEISWTLQNKFSPIAPFHHRMKFDVEYMDEEYIKSITLAHRQLSEPDVDTEERTSLLATIIGTCLQARGATQELHESLSSDPEGPSYRMRTTLDREPEVPGTQRRSKKSTIMAPPKSVPKKNKPKQKEDTNANSKPGKGVKRSNQHGGDEISGKKSKIVDKEFEKETVGNDQEIAKIIENIEKRQENQKTDYIVTKTVTQKKKKAIENDAIEKTATKEVEKKKKSIASVKNTEQKDANEKNGEPHELGKKLSVKSKNVVSNVEKSSNEVAKKKVNDDKKQTNIEKQTKKAGTHVENAGRLENNAASRVAIEKKAAEAKSAQNSATKKGDYNAKKVLQAKVVKKTFNTSKYRKVGKVVSKPTQVQKPATAEEKAEKVAVATKKVAEHAKKVVDATKKVVGPTKKVVDTANKVMNSTFTTEKSSVSTLREKLPNVSPIPKIVASAQNKNPTMKRNAGNNILPSKKAIQDTNKPKSGIVKPKHTVVSKNLPLNPSNKPKFGITKLAGGKITKSGNTEKENKVVTKIPLKNTKSLPEAIVKKHPLRISPRKGISKPGAKQFSGTKTAKSVSTTNIPRLIKPKSRVT